MINMYWHLLLEEFINRYAVGAPRYYLPFLDDPEDNPTEKTPSSKPRLDLPGGLYLTHREAECIKLMLTGKTMKAIADQLSLSPRTVEYYIKRLKERWKCKNKKELLALLQRQDMNVLLEHINQNNLET